MAKISGKLDISSTILFDSGCSQHTFFDKESFIELRIYDKGEKVSSITGIGGTILQPMGIGTVSILSNIDDKEVPLTINNVLYCPDLRANLISCSQLLDYGVLITL